MAQGAKAQVAWGVGGSAEDTSGAPEMVQRSIFQGPSSLPPPTSAPSNSFTMDYFS